MNYEVAVASMHVIANTGRKGFLDGLGISRSDFERLVGSDPWLGTERNRMTVVLDSLINASVDSQALPRFNLPAEYRAAGIAVFVHPVNMQAACIFAASSRPKSAEEMGRMATVDPCSAEQVFALVLQLCGSQSRNGARAQFEKNTALALDQAMVESGSSKKGS